MIIEKDDTAWLDLHGFEHLDRDVVDTLCCVLLNTLAEYSEMSRMREAHGLQTV